MSRILITGASGFLGQALVQATRVAGSEVVAISRTRGVAIDLGRPDAVQALAQHLEGVTAVIHAAASFTGNAGVHARNTIRSTDHLVTALQNASERARLVLVSSLSVYDVASLSDHATLDEATPLVTQAAQRDAYAAAKALQERRLLTYMGPKTVIRPGAIYGPHRLWSAHLGFVKWGRVLCPGGEAHVPAIEVTRAAQAIVRAALTGQGDDTVNLVDPDPPTQAQWIAALGLPMVRVPRALVLRAGHFFSRGSGWAARFRPLRYDTTRAEVLLESNPSHTFADAIARAKLLEKECGS